MGDDIGRRVTGELQGTGNAVVRPVLNISTEELFTISSGNLVLYGTTRTLNTRWHYIPIGERQSMTAKIRVCGGSKNGVPWKVEEAMR